MRRCAAARSLFEGNLEDCRTAMEGQHLVIFRGVFDEALAAAIRGAVQQWAAMTEPFPRGESASRPA